MRRSSRILPAIVILFTVALPTTIGAQQRPSIDEFLAPAYPFELVSAASADRIAWLSYQSGRRDVYTAAAPRFRPVRFTRTAKDDRLDLTDLRISRDGATVVFVRGHAPNRDGWVANPTSDPHAG